MIYLSGEIDITTVMSEAQREKEWLAAWRERCRRQELRREEELVLRAYWTADEADRRAIVEKNAEVFERIRKNRREAHRIEALERSLVDLNMKRLGYVIRPGRDWPRYVRPEYSRTKDGRTPNGQGVMYPCS